MGQVTAFCNEAVEIIGAGLNYDGGLISDEQLHGVFWQIVEKHGIPLSSELRDSAEEDGGHAQQIAIILDALCRDHLQTPSGGQKTTTKQPLPTPPTDDIITARPSINYDQAENVDNEILPNNNAFVVGQSFSFGPSSPTAASEAAFDPSEDYEADNSRPQLRKGSVEDSNPSRRGYLMSGPPPPPPRHQPRPMKRPPQHPRGPDYNRRNENDNVPGWRRILPKLPKLPSLPNILNFGNYKLILSYT